MLDPRSNGTGTLRFCAIEWCCDTNLEHCLCSTTFRVCHTNFFVRRARPRSVVSLWSRIAFCSPYIQSQSASHPYTFLNLCQPSWQFTEPRIIKFAPTVSIGEMEAVLLIADVQYYIVVYVTLINGSTPLTTPVLDDCTHYRIRKSCAWHSVGGGVFHLISQRFIWLICLFSPKSVDGNLYFLASQAKSLVLNFVSSCFIHSTSELTSSSDALQAP